MLLYEIGNEVVHLPLSACDRHDAIVSERKAKSRTLQIHHGDTEMEKSTETLQASLYNNYPAVETELATSQAAVTFRALPQSNERTFKGECHG